LIAEISELRLPSPQFPGGKKVDEAPRECGKKYQIAYALWSASIFWADVQIGIIIDCNRATERTRDSVMAG
jgi:hypothetical protein